MYKPALTTNVLAINTALIHKEIWLQITATPKIKNNTTKQAENNINIVSYLGDAGGGGSELFKLGFTNITGLELSKTPMAPPALIENRVMCNS